MKTMKKTLIISAIAAAFLGTGCVSNDVFSPEEKQVEICFTTPVVGSMTKAEINGTTYPTEENFVIYAVRHPYSYDGWASDNATTYINGGEFTYDRLYDDGTEGSGGTAGSGGWKGINTYYWPESGVLSFGGYSPAGIQGTFTYNAAGLKIESFAIKTNAAEHQDLMYAERVYNKKNNTTDANNATYDGVDIAFKHALSSIQFKVQLSANYSSIFKLTSIKVGQVKYSGTFTEGITETITKDSTTGTITVDSDNAPAWSVAKTVLPNITPYVAFSSTDGLVLNNNYKDGTTDNYLTLDGVTGQNDLILMPQEFVKVVDGSDVVVNSDAEIVIEYTVNDSPQSSTVKLSDIITYKWEIGKRYTYNITLGYDLILVGATVEKWEENDDINIPIS